MQTIDTRIINSLVLACGFSTFNAAKALELFYQDKLTATQKEVISKIRLKPEDDSVGDIYRRTLNHLNYTITQNGGDAKTKSRV